MYKATPQNTVMRGDADNRPQITDAVIISAIFYCKPYGVTAFVVSIEELVQVVVNRVYTYVSRK